MPASSVTLNPPEKHFVMSYLNGLNPIGYEYPTRKAAWLKRDSLLFSYSVGCEPDNEMHFLWDEHKNFSTFPTYPLMLQFKRDDQDVIDTLPRVLEYLEIPGIPKIDASRFVDAERHLIILKPLPVTSEGLDFEIRVKCFGVWDKGKGSGVVVETEYMLFETTAQIAYAKVKVVGVAIGQGGWGGPRGPARQLQPEPDFEPDFTIPIPTTDKFVFLYRLNGDYHPHNIIPVPPFKRPILPGTAILSLTCCAILRALCQSDPRRLREFGATFASPAYPGDTLILDIWYDKGGDTPRGLEGWKTIFFSVRTVVGMENKFALRGGSAVIRPVEERTRL